VAAVVVAVLAVLAVRAIADDANEPPAFTEASGEGSAAEAPEEEPVRFSVAATGDFLIHSPVFAVALENGGGDRYDFAPMFEQIKPYIEDADLGICHVETPMTDAEPIGYPVFNTPPDLARAIAETGWDVCSTASNHTLDQGQEGIDETNRVLDREEIAHAGSYSSRAGSEEPTIVDVEGVKVAFLAYTEMTNGVPLPKPWSVNLTKVDQILADAAQAREQGAQVVIVNLHAGDEYVAEPSASQKKLAERLTKSDDVTAVIGQHVHIVQPIEEVNDKVVVYGEGNLVSNQDIACCPAESQDGIIALLDFVVEGDEARVERARYVPVYVQHPDYTVLPVGDALADGTGDATALEDSYERTVDVVGKRPAKPEPERLR
jgi:poly-gamma-glutamate synthesis protein (capsule biosynthesis protein)